MMRVEVTEEPRRGLAVAWRPVPAGRRIRRDPARAASRSTPRRPALPAAPGPSRHSGSPAESPDSARTPITAPSPTRSAGSPRPCTSTRAATAVRRPSPACTRSAGRPRRLTLLHLDGSDNALPTQVLRCARGARGRLRRQLGPPPRATARSPSPCSSATRPRRRARRRRPACQPGGRRRPRGRPARPPQTLTRSASGRTSEFRQSSIATPSWLRVGLEHDCGR